MRQGVPPTGFAVEVEREATLRIWMQKEWRRQPKTTEKALTTGAMLRTLLANSDTPITTLRACLDAGRVRHTFRFIS